MLTFRKKSVVVEAAQFFASMTRQEAAAIYVSYCSGNIPHLHTVHDEQSPVNINDRDWIIVEADIFRYSCKPEIFEAIYEQI